MKREWAGKWSGERGDGVDLLAVDGNDVEKATREKLDGIINSRLIAREQVRGCRELALEIEAHRNHSWCLYCSENCLHIRWKREKKASVQAIETILQYCFEKKKSLRCQVIECKLNVQS